MDGEEQDSKLVKPLWHNRDYLLLWFGQTVSSFGSRASHIVLPLLILDLTHSPAQAGFVGAITTIPYALLGLYAGTLTDRLNRKKVMMITDVGRMLAMGSVFVALWMGQITIIQLYIVALLEGIFFVFFDLAEIASIKRIVGKENLATATAQNMVTDSTSLLLGPSLGATLYQTVGKSIPFLVDAISYIVSFLSLFFIKTEFQEERQEKNLNLKEDLMEGIRWLLRNPIIRSMALLNAAQTFVYADIYLIIIVLAKEQHASATQIGAVVSIAAIGSIIGSIFGVRILKRFNAGHILIGVSWIQALLFPLYILAPNFIVIGIITAAIFIFNPISGVTVITYRLSKIPDDLQGRVNSVYRFMYYSTIPIGMALTGIFLQSLGAKNTVLIFFLILVLLSILASINKELRSIRTLTK